MKIGNITSTAATTAVNGDRKAATSNLDKKTSGTGSAEVDSSTQVELSPAASLLSAASADPAFDTEKVNRIAQAIKDGKFTVNHGAIADKLIANAQELLGRTSSH
jgi:negative regulator of flagellin synthesis FlgM